MAVMMQVHLAHSKVHMCVYQLKTCQVVLWHHLVMYVAGKVTIAPSAQQVQSSGNCLLHRQVASYWTAL